VIDTQKTYLFAFTLWSGVIWHHFSTF